MFTKHDYSKWYQTDKFKFFYGSTTQFINIRVPIRFLAKEISHLNFRLKNADYLCNMNLLKSLLFFTIPVIILISASCKKDKLLNDSSASIDFSTDSVLFDTVFKYAGSTTKKFKIYNNHRQPILISSIQLAGGKGSAYRINVDGISSYEFTNVEVPSKDSLFIFVQVTVNPSQNAPLLIKDSIIFLTNGNLQDVKLTAIGQDVYLHKPDHFQITGYPYSIIGREGHDTILPNDKPHLFFGYAVIDSDCKLTLQAGTRLYFHNKAVLWVYDKGTLIVQGTYKNEVVFQGDRLENDYKDMPGQWGKIWLSQGSLNNRIDWAIIKNATVGIQVDSVTTPNAPTLKLSNTIIKNMQSVAIWGLDARIWSYNCVFANCGECTAAFQLGGIYRFEHCTFTNYWSQKQRTKPLLILNNYYDANGIQFIRNLDSAYFGNCILQGDLEEEIGLDSSLFGGKFSYKFDHCILKTARVVSNTAYYKNIYKNGDAAFKDVKTNNYHLTSTSVGIDKGYSTPLTTDLENKARPNISTSLPDLGAYEFYP